MVAGQFTSQSADTGQGSSIHFTQHHRADVDRASVRAKVLRKRASAGSKKLARFARRAYFVQSEPADAFRRSFRHQIPACKLRPGLPSVGSRQQNVLWGHAGRFAAARFRTLRAMSPGERLEFPAKQHLEPSVFVEGPAHDTLVFDGVSAHGAPTPLRHANRSCRQPCGGVRKPEGGQRPVMRHHGSKDVRSLQKPSEGVPGSPGVVFSICRPYNSGQARMHRRVSCLQQCRTCPGF